jgi:type IV secretory pathway VirB2 component (pilin)
MPHPIFSVLIRRPELVMEHVAGYATLLRDEASSVGGEIAKRAIAWGVAVLCFIVFVVLAGVALMLGALQGQFHWVLLVVPGLALALAAVAWNYARQKLPEKAFAEFKAQLDADAEALRAIGARS